MLPALLWLLIEAPEGSERRVQPASISASSFRAAADGTLRCDDHPYYAVDDDPKTAWTEGEPGLGPGPWIELAIPPLADTTLVQIKIRGGNQASKALFKASARPKDLKVILLPSLVTVSFALKDADGWQTLKLEQPSGPFEGVRLELLSGWPGSKDAEANMISDLEVHATSRAAETTSFEKVRFERIQAWKKERALAMKLWQSSGKNGLPVAGHYQVKSIAPPSAAAPPKDQREAARAIVELAKSDADQPQLAALEVAALALRPDFAAWRRVDLDLDPGVMPMVDGLCTPELGAVGCGGFEGPALPRLALLSALSFQVTAAKDAVTIEQALLATAPKCTEPDTGQAYAFAFEERVETEEGSSRSKLRALLLVRCGVIAARAGHESRSALQLLMYGEDGMLSASIVPHAAIAWLWEADSTSPKLAGARRQSFERGIEVLGE